MGMRLVLASGAVSAISQQLDKPPGDHTELLYRCCLLHTLCIVSVPDSADTSCEGTNLNPRIHPCRPKGRAGQ